MEANVEYDRRELTPQEKREYWEQGKINRDARDFSINRQDLVRVQDLATIFDTTKQSILRWGDHGILPSPCIDDPSYRLYHKTDLLRWLHTIGMQIKDLNLEKP